MNLKTIKETVKKTNLTEEWDALWRSPDLKKIFRLLIDVVVGGMTFILLVIYPLYIKNRYGEVVEGKYRLYWMTVLAALAAVIFLSLTFLAIDQIRYGGKNRKKSFEKFARGGWKEIFGLHDLFLAAFMVCVILSTLQTEYLYESVWGNEGRYSGAFVLLLYGISVFLIGKLLRFHQIYLELFLIASMGVCLIGIADYFNWDPMEFKIGLIRNQTLFTSTFGNINVYTAFVDIVMGTAAALFLSARGKRTYWYYICMVIAFTAAITGRSNNVYLAFGVIFGFLPFYGFSTRKGISRYLMTAASFFTIIEVLEAFEGRTGTELGMVIGMDGLAEVIGNADSLIIFTIFLWIFAFALRFVKFKETDKPTGKWLRYSWGVFLILIIAVSAAAFWDANIGGHGGRYGRLAPYLVFSDNWGTDRGFVWKFAMELYNQFPLIHKIFGYGADTFGILTTQYNGDTMVRMYQEFGVYYDNAHNAFLQYLVTLGAAGVTAYVLFFISSIVWMIRKAGKSPAVLACVFGAACYFAQSSVNIELPGVTPAFWTILAVGLAAARRESRGKTEKTRDN